VFVSILISNCSFAFLSQQRAKFDEENTRLKEFAEEFQKSLAPEKLTGKFSLVP